MGTRISLSRRTFLSQISALAAIGAGSSLLQACGPAAATPTAVPAAPKATTAPAAAATTAPAAATTAPAAAATTAPAAATVAVTAKPAAKQTQVTFTARIGPQQEHFDAFGKLFMEKYPNIKYVPQHITTNDWNQKILVLAAGGTLPDALWLFLTYFRMFVNKNLVQDISAQAKALNVDLKAFYPVAIESQSTEGKLFGIPWVTHPGRSAIFFNKALFDAAAIKQPTENWTWADLITAANALTKRSGNRVEQFGYAPDTTLGGFHMTLRTYGGEYISADGKKAVFDSPEAVRAIQEGVADMYTKHKVSPTPDLVEGGAPQMFGSKRVAMFQSGYWGISDIGNYAKDIPWGVVPMPLQPNGKLGTLGADVNSVSKTAKDPEAAALFCAFMGSKEAGIDIAMRGSVPGCRPDVWSDPSLVAKPGHSVFAKILAGAPKHNVLANFRDSEFDVTFTKAFDPIKIGQESDAGKLIKEVIPSLQAIVDKPAD